MELTNLILNNIGPYKEYNEFQLHTTKQKNTILIGGKNGAGKTTFLNTVRLALYGPLAFGYKTTSKEYLTKVSSLFNHQALRTKHSSFYIQVEISLVDNFQKFNYSIRREWDIKNDKINEYVLVKQDDKILNEIEKDNFFEYLRTTFPPSLLELCFFDGEDITRLSNEKLLSGYLSDLSMKLFNLDLFSNLEKDIMSYISQTSTSENEQILENERIKLEKEIELKNKAITTLTAEIEKLENDLQDGQTKYDQIKKEFSIHGGLFLEEREKIQKEITIIEQQRKQRNDSIKKFIGSYLPFFLAYPVFKNLINQLYDEEDYYISENIKKKIKQLNLKIMFEDTNIPLDKDSINHLKTKLINYLTSSKKPKVIFNASKSEVNKIYNTFTLLNKDHFNKFVKMIQDDKEDLSRLRELKETIKDNESTVEFHEMIIELEELNKKNTELKNVIMELSTQLDNINDELNNLNKKYEKVKNELYKIYKSKSSFSVSEKVLRICKKFREDQLRKKLKDAEFFSTKMFKDLLRKKSFVSRIEICPRDFNVSIFDNDYKKINKNILSAGEKQLLVLSVIWGMIKSSKKQLPFVLDTLLGRLDLEHKNSVVTKLIPKFGEQIIILSTDSEIDKNLYLKLVPYVANKYTLNYDNENKKTLIETHFFNY